MSQWLGNTNSNRFKQIYLQGFLDISGGDLTLRNGGISVNGNTIMNGALNNYSYDKTNFSALFGNTWVDSKFNSGANIFQSISISATGQYQCAVSKNNVNGNGNIFVSSNYGSNNSWIDSNQKSPVISGVTTSFNKISISGNGKYISAIVHPLSSSLLSGTVFSSTNYGNNWNTYTINPFTGFIQSLSMSFTGQYQTIVSAGTQLYNGGSVTSGNIYVSSDYGVNWTSKQSLINGFQSVAISSTGQYQVTVQCGTSSNPNGNIFNSNTYGNSWNDTGYGIKNYNTITNTNLINNYELSQTVAISYDGKYQTILSINSGGNIFINDNYGSANRWRDTNIQNPYGSNGYLSSVSMSSTGQYQIVSACNLPASYSGLGQFSAILLSTDYGSTWNTITNDKLGIPTVLNVSNTFPSISVSANGNYISGCIKYYSDSRIQSGNVFTSSINTSLNPNLSIQYFGSDCQGNVFSNHPFNISLPNNLNNGLYMGYDTANDGAYVNSLNIVGSKNLYLQSQGGFIGVGTTAPSYPLDISGSVNVSGISYSQNVTSNSFTIGSGNINYSNSYNVYGSGFSRGIVMNSDNLFLRSSNMIMDTSTNGNILLQPYAGNVAIGKLFPISTLDVSGFVNITNNRTNVPALTLTGASGGILFLNGNATSTPGIQFDTSLNRQYTNPSAQILAVDVSSNTNDLIFKTAPYANSGASSNVERMRITNTGRIGIGTSRPGLPIAPFTNELTNCKLDISGTVRIYEAQGSGNSSSIGSLILQHGDSNGKSSILFTGNPGGSSDPLGNDYGSITYYDNVSTMTQNTFPNYYPSSSSESSALVIDVGNNNDATYGYDNLILRSSAYAIVDTKVTTYFVNGISVGKKNIDSGYLLDVNGGMNTNFIAIKGNVNCGNINAGGNLLNIGNIVCSSLINTTDISTNKIRVFGDISGNRLFVSGNIDCSSNINANVINVNGALNLKGGAGLDMNGNISVGNATIRGVLNVTDTTDGDIGVGSIITQGGISCNESMYVGGDLTVDGTSKTYNVNTGGITIGTYKGQSPSGLVLKDGASITVNGSGTINTPTINVTSFSSTGNITCGGVLKANGGIVAEQGYEINSKGTFTANGASTFNGTIQANSLVNTGTSSIVDIGNTNDVIGTPTLGNLTNAGALRVRGGFYCDKTIYGNGTIIASKSLNIPSGGNLIANGPIFANDSITFNTQNGKTISSESITVTDTLNVNKFTMSNNGNLYIQSGISITVNSIAKMTDICCNSLTSAGNIFGNVRIPFGKVLDAVGDILGNSITVTTASVKSTLSFGTGTLNSTTGGINCSSINCSGTGTAITSSGIVSISNSTASTSASTGALVVTGGIGCSGAINTSNTINTSGIVTISNSTPSTSASTGALIINNGGGIGCSGAINTSSTVNASSFSGNLSYGANGLYINNSANSNSNSVFVSGAIFGNVGIGTTTPSVKLDVSGQVKATSFVGNLSYGAAGLSINNSSNTTVVFVSNTGSGTVGIRNTNPSSSYAMDIAGDVNMGANSVIYGAGQACLYPRFNNTTYLNYGTAGFQIRNNASTVTMFMTNDGKVGIGNSSPAYALDVTGQVNATSFSGSLSGTATSANNIIGSTIGGIPYQSAANTTLFTSAGATGQVLTSGGGTSAPTWRDISAGSVTTQTGSNNASYYLTFVGSSSPSSQSINTNSNISVNPSSGTISATTFSGNLSGTATTANHIIGTTVGGIHYQSGTNQTSISNAGTSGQVLISGGTSAPTWSNFSPSNISSANSTSGRTMFLTFVDTAGTSNAPIYTNTNISVTPSTGTISATTFSGSLSGGSAGSIPYQTSANTTAFTTIAPTNGQLLSWNGSAAVWTTLNTSTNATNVATTLNNSANSSYYLTFVQNNTSSTQAINVSTNVSVNPSTGTVSATAFNGNLTQNSNNLIITQSGTGTNSFKGSNFSGTVTMNTGSVMNLFESAGVNYTQISQVNINTFLIENKYNSGSIYLRNKDPSGALVDYVFAYNGATFNNTLYLLSNNVVAYKSGASQQTNLGQTGSTFVCWNLTNSGSILLRVQNSSGAYIEAIQTNYATTTIANNLVCNGTIQATSFNATSDYRMKQNVQSLSKTKTIDNLKPVEYDLSGGSHDMGFLAHEVQAEYPFLVQGEKDGDSMQSLNYNGFIALLVKEVQELKSNFKTISHENEMLRETVKSLESKIEILGKKP